MTRPAGRCRPRCAAPQFLAAEYAQVVLPNRITSREAYYKVRRPGRGVALDRAKRAAVWDVIEAYRAQARIAGSVDFAEAATIAAAHLRRVASAHGAFVADHVLVDEGQDLGPAHWQLMRALVGEHADDLFIAEDSHQRIYGQRIVLSQFGIRIVGRSQRLTLNYRTTAQNLAYAINVLEGGKYVDLEDAAGVFRRLPVSAQRPGAAADPVRDADRGTRPGGGPYPVVGRGDRRAGDHRRSRAGAAAARPAGYRPGRARRDDPGG